MTSSPALPIIDISRLASCDLADRPAVARELDSACVDVGFLYVTGEQLDTGLFTRLLRRAQAYFALDYATKMRRYIGLSENHSGYVPTGEEQFGEGLSDLKEAYDVNLDYRLAAGRRPLLGPNLWPELPGFRDDVLAYYDHVTGIGRQLFRGFALALGLAENYFEAHRRHPPSQLRLIHYPHDASAEDRSGIGAHTDYECFTLLFATAPGLQIVDKMGEWIDVPQIDGALIMNVGDMMEIMSNGRYLATRHRVRKVKEERFSFPLFMACDYDHVVAPLVSGEAPRYAPLKAGEHLFNQTARSFAYLKQRIADGELVLTERGETSAFGMRERAATA